jgi:hypothetical protein
LCSTPDSPAKYSPSDCFDTFPFPQADPRTIIPAIESAGETLHEARARFMVDTNQGLTKTYNALKDPASTDARILVLRRLHEAMDRAVLDAYGWTDVAVPPYCPLDDVEKAQVKTFEDEVIDRLYALNAERVRAKRRAWGLARKPRGDEGEGREEGEGEEGRRRWWRGVAGRYMSSERLQWQLVSGADRGLRRSARGLSCR